MDRYLLLAIAKPYTVLALPLAVLSPLLFAAHEPGKLIAAIPGIASFAAAFAFSRLVRDGEIDALRAAGTPMGRVLAGPVVFAALFALAAVGSVSLFWVRPTPWVLRVTQALASILLVVVLLPLSVRYARRDAYLPWGIGIGLLGVFEAVVALAWYTASDDWTGSFRVTVVDVLAIGGVLYHLQKTESPR